MSKRIIDFLVYVDQLDKEAGGETVRVEFDWDGNTDTLMKQAEDALEKEIGNTPLLVDYQIQYWDWVL